MATIISKVTDPSKVVTDEVLLKALEVQGIDKDYVEFAHDYGVRDKSKGRSPFMKSYRDLKTGKRFSVSSGLPKTRADGTKLVVGFKTGNGKFISDTNLFELEIKGTRVTLEVLNDQPGGVVKAGDSVVITSKVYVDGAERSPISETGTLLATDPINENLHNNVVEWYYGVCKRRIRILEGRYRESFILSADPKAEIQIDYAQTGALTLAFGKAAQSSGVDAMEPLKATKTGSALTISKEELGAATYPVVIN